MPSQPGQMMRSIRTSLGYTLSEVAAASERIAEQKENSEFAVGVSRLSDIESKGIIPSLHKLYSLAVIYRVEVEVLARFYGVDLSIDLQAASEAVCPPRTHALPRDLRLDEIPVPSRLDPTFSLTETHHLSRVIQEWGVIPLTFLAGLQNDRYTYGYIGSRDYSMYPILLPGSFIQIDETLTSPPAGPFSSELERPIYFVETRDGFRCCWCVLKKNCIQLIPHSLSAEELVEVRYPQDAEIIGQVVAVAMNLRHRDGSFKSKQQSV